MSKAYLGSISPYVLGHDSDGNLKGIKGPTRKEWNGEWIISEITEGMSSNVIHNYPDSNL